MADDRILLVRLAASLPEAGRWGLPGGGVEWGEAPVDALVREVREETGLHATASGVAGVCSATFDSSFDGPGNPLHLVSIVHWITTTGGELVHERDGTTDLAAWVPLDEAASAPLGVVARFGLRLLSQAGQRGGPTL